MTVDWTAALVLLTGFIAVCGGFTWVTRLAVRAEVADLHKIFLPRKEAAVRDRDVGRRLHELELLKAAAK